MRHHLLVPAVVAAVLIAAAPAVAAGSFTVSSAAEWENGTFDDVEVRDGRLGLTTPIEVEGFETTDALEYWTIYRGDAFVPEEGFTGNDAIAFHNSTPLPGGDYVTQLNYSIPRGFTFQTGDTFSAWTRHNGTEDSDYRVLFRLDGGSGMITGAVDETAEEVTCSTGQEAHVAASNASVNTWYRFVFTVYPAAETVHCEVQDDAGETISAANLSTTVDFSRIVIRGTGDPDPWAWFDDVSVPRYRAEGAYRSQNLDNGSIRDWQHLTVDAANITADSVVDAVFQARDSSGTIMHEDVIPLSNGTQTYLLDAPNSRGATVRLNGTTDNPANSWSIGSYAVVSNTTNVSAPSISDPAVDPQEGEQGDTFTFTAELTDDDSEQNTVTLWTRRDGTTAWTLLDRQNITPDTVNTEITAEHTFTDATPDDYVFIFNTTDASGFTDSTDPAAYTLLNGSVGGTDDTPPLAGNGTANDTVTGTNTTGAAGESPVSGNETGEDDEDTAGPTGTDQPTGENTGGDTGQQERNPWNWRIAAGMLLFLIIVIQLFRMSRVS